MTQSSFESRFVWPPSLPDLLARRGVQGQQGAERGGRWSLLCEYIQSPWHVIRMLGEDEHSIPSNCMEVCIMQCVENGPSHGWSSEGWSEGKCSQSTCAGHANTTLPQACLSQGREGREAFSSPFISTLMLGIICCKSVSSLMT